MQRIRASSATGDRRTGCRLAVVYSSGSITTTATTAAASDSEGLEGEVREHSTEEEDLSLETPSQES